MNSTYRTILVAAACMAACSSPEDLCQSDADCGQGSFCDTTLAVKACVKKDIQLCDKSCGDGFLCVVEDGADRCKVESGREGTAAIREPASGVAVNGGVVRIVCEAKGPQFRAVKATATPPGGGTPIVLGEPARLGSTDEFETTWNVEAAAEGAYALGCALEYGPEGETVTTQAAPVELVVDKAAPTVAHTAPAGWLKHATTQLRATVKDDGTRPSGIANVRIEFATEPVVMVAGAAAADDEYTFDANVASLGVEEGPVSYEVIATDRAGNETKTSGTLQVDGKGAVATPVADASWHRRSGLIALFTGTSATGAPVASVAVRKGSLTWSGTKNGNEWVFDLGATELIEAGVEATVGVEVVVVDEAGNETSTPTTVRIDDKGPTVEIPAPAEWTNAGQKDVFVLVRDAGAGMTGGNVTWLVGSQNGACTKEATVAEQYRCVVPVATANGNVDLAYAFQVRAADALTNARTESGSLKVDKKGPTVVTPAVDGKWYRRGETVVVRLKVADEHSGVLGATAPLFATTNPSSSTAGTIDGDGNVTFQVRTADISTAGLTTGAIAVTMRVFDRIGNELTLTPNSLLRVDDEKPTVGTPAVSYATNRNNALRRDPAGSGRDRVTVMVTATDPSTGSGVTSDTIKLAYPKKGGGTERIGPTNSASPWTFALDVATAEFNQGEGTLAATLEAGDDAGNQATAVSVPVAVTRKLWEYTAGLVPSAVKGGVAVASGKVFFTLGLHGAAGDNVYAVNVASGQKEWSAKVSTGTPTTPITVGNNLLYFASDADGGSLHSFAPTQSSAIGVEAWRCSGYGIAKGALAYATVNWQATPSETVFYASDEPGLHALRRNTSGCDQKTSGVFGLPVGDGVVTFSGATVAVGSSSGRIARVDLASTSGLFSGSVRPTATPSGAAVPLSGGVWGAPDQFFFSYPPNIFRLGAGDVVTYEGGASDFTTASQAPVLLSGQRAAFGAESGHVFVFDVSAEAPVASTQVRSAQGVARAVRSTAVAGEDSSGVISLYLGANDQSFHAYSSASVEQWQLHLGTNLESHPALDCKGVAYIGGTNGRVFAIITDSAGLARSAWPKFQHDNRNTGSLTTPLPVYVNGVCQD